MYGRAGRLTHGTAMIGRAAMAKKTNHSVVGPDAYVNHAQWVIEEIRPHRAGAY
jgi:hypothetical protein